MPYLIIIDSDGYEYGYIKINDYTNTTVTRTIQEALDDLKNIEKQ
ncbi:MAG: hypothetical protein ACOCRX_01300 [Candidatus Woesearchaeota archaeon]